MNRNKVKSEIFEKIREVEAQMRLLKTAEADQALLRLREARMWVRESV